MIRVFLAAALFAVLPLTAGAQVEKQVEVTKAYVPSVGDAQKLAVVPDMTDTTRMRPEIDYTITPLSLHTMLETRPIRPATVTYWEFNRPLPFYLKAGAGYPLNSVVDFYASSQNPGTGYVVGYINHEGRYAKIADDWGQKNNATQMLNRIGTAAGKYFGRHILEGTLSYENRLYHRYGLFDAGASRAVNYGDANVAVRFGDDFKDLSRVNFEVALHGGFFFDHSDWDDYNTKARQTDFGVDAKIARGFGRHRLSVAAGYQRIGGLKAIDEYRQHLIHAALRYGVQGGVVDFEAGADYFHDKNRGVKTGNYIIPFARLDFNLGTPGLKPFIELDGSLRDNSFRSLTRLNPYVASPVEDATLGPLFAPAKSSVDYNGRFGVGGSLWRERFNYRLYAQFSIHDNHLYWFGAPRTLSQGDGGEELQMPYPGLLLPTYDRQTVTSFNGEVEWRPVSPLRVWLGAHGYIYNDDTWMGNGSASFKGDAGLRFDGRKIAFGVSAAVQSVRKWTLLISDDEHMTFEAPFAVDLRAEFEWKVSARVTLFAEGRNLANRRLYEFPWFPEYGANFTAGVKMNF